MARKETKRTSETNGHVATMGTEVSDQSVRELAQVFKLLSDETRLRILFYLALSPHGELLLSLFSAADEVPHNTKYRFHDFMLTYSGK